MNDEHTHTAQDKNALSIAQEKKKKKRMKKSLHICVKIEILI